MRVRALTHLPLNWHCPLRLLTTAKPDLDLIHAHTLSHTHTVHIYEKYFTMVTRQLQPWSWFSVCMSSKSSSNSVKYKTLPESRIINLIFLLLLQSSFIDKWGWCWWHLGLWNEFDCWMNHSSYFTSFSTP